MPLVWLALTVSLALLFVLAGKSTDGANIALMQELPATSYTSRADEPMMGVYICFAESGASPKCSMSTRSTFVVYVCARSQPSAANATTNATTNAEPEMARVGASSHAHVSSGGGGPSDRDRPSPIA